jgi:ficolin
MKKITIVAITCSVIMGGVTELPQCNDIKDSLAINSYANTIKSELGNKIDNINCDTSNESQLNKEIEKLKTQNEEILIKLKEIKINTNVTKKYVSCLDLKNSSFNTSGIYNIYLNGQKINVYCDMETDGGGWTVIQRRVDNTDFYKNWLNYKLGFGDLKKSFWLGNDNIYFLTKNKKELRIDMKSNGVEKYAYYSNFKIDSEMNKYKMTVDGASGNVCDAFIYHSGKNFSTYDQDNDIDNGNCSTEFKGGWWYGSCHSSNLNGKYLNGAHSSYADGINWECWTTYYYSMQFAEMKIR